jgi:hypothetical protein
MMPSIIKVKGPQVAVTTANTVNNANLVRVYASSNTIITIAGTVSGSFTMTAGNVEYVEKGATDTIASGTGTAYCTPVSYRA